MPGGQFDNVMLNAALEYFTPAEANDLMSAIKARLAPSGVLSGNSIVAQPDRVAYLDQRQAFYSGEELAIFWLPIVPMSPY